MKRNKFLKICGLGCLGLVSGTLLLESCAGVNYVTGTLNNEFLEFPTAEFEIEKDNETHFRKYIVVDNSNLKFPICVYRNSKSDYTALLMRCTHQGNELQVFGDRLQCPAHGSEFTKSGVVQNGPAEANLRTFPIQINQDTLTLNLS